MEVKYTHPCIVLGGQTDAVCRDRRNYTKWALQDGDIPSNGEDIEGREIWYCQAHATDYLFPVIDRAVGNTTQRIIKDFRWDGMWK